MYILGKDSRAVLDTVDIELRVLMKESIKESPHDFKCMEGYRSTRRQQELYRQGREKGDERPIVTTMDGVYRISKHQKGKAVDIAIWENGKPNWNTRKLMEVRKHIAETAVKLGIKLGKQIKWDLPHYELA